MRFTFIHTADWQIGKRFGGFDERLAGRLEEARLDAIDRLAELAGEHSASHVLVAGDVYDAPGLKERTLRQPLSRMGSYPNVRWVLLPGNHDPAGPGSVWTSVRRIGVPGNVIIADTAVPFELAPGVVVLPAPLMGKATLSDPTAWMDGSGPFDGGIRIGLAHGGVHGFGSEGECAVPIDSNRVGSARLDYLALGDWHGMKRIGPRCWYAGTPEPDNFANSAKGHALVVRIEKERGDPDVLPVQIGAFTWVRHEARITSSAEFAALEREIQPAAGEARRTLVNLKFSGSLTAQDLSLLEAWLADLDGRLQYLNADTAEIALAVEADENAMAAIFGADGELREVAERLAKLARGQDGSTAGEVLPPEVARTALLRLMTFARAESESV